MTIPPIISAAAAVGVGFLLVHLFTRGEAGATAGADSAGPTGKEVRLKPATQGNIQGILDEGGSWLTAKAQSLGLGVTDPVIEGG